jgi:hypothetical protein
MEPLVLEPVRHWLHAHHAFGWVAVAAPVTFVLSLIGGLAVVVHLPADFFVRHPGRRSLWHAHPALRVALLLAKNAVGAFVFVAGVVMAMPLVPGPGVLFMLLGLGLVDFPGKRSLERRLLRVPRVLTSVNKLRARFAQPPLLADPGPNLRD